MERPFQGILSRSLVQPEVCRVDTVILALQVGLADEVAAEPGRHPAGAEIVIDGVGETNGLVPAKSAPYQEQPVVVPHVTHLRQVPLRTMVNQVIE